MPLEEICKQLHNNSAQLEAWFNRKWQGLKPLPYFSCDIRHATYKLGIVDTNLFPAGFNNLCNAFTKETAQAFNNYFTRHYPAVKNILLFGENHTRNKFYLYNLVKLQSLIESTGRHCRITLPLEHFSEDRIQIPLDEKTNITVERVEAVSGTLKTNSFTADLVLANNDFSSGLPAFLSELLIPIIPSPDLGWHKRYKSGHFKILNELFDDFGKNFGIDPWQLMPYTEIIDNVNEANLSGLAQKVDEVLKSIQKKYAEYQISETPFVFIKNDSGTYGLGIVTVSSADEVLSLNRKKRSKLFSAKGSNQTSRFLVQEGIPTYDTYSGYPIEPVIYGVGENSVGGFFRLHEGKSAFESLNAPGMSFSCLCLHKLDEPHESYFLNCKDKQLLVTGSKFMARFASLAAAIEAQNINA